MISLANDQLTVELLDPPTNRARLGPRFCWGGYIWQVHDLVAGPLLTGPEWPSASPLPFNGQGLPESFRHQTRAGRRLTWRGEYGVAIGVGTLSLSDDKTVRVDRPCIWEVSSFVDRAVFQTRQAAFGFSYELVRMIELAGRDLLSVTKLTNHGQEPLVLEWFAHPFFALSDGEIKAELPADTSLQPNPGFELNGRTLRNRRAFIGQNDGHFDQLSLPTGHPLKARLNHPNLTHLDFVTSFVPSECVIWANGNTFSLEPYLALTLAPGATRQWSLCYRFGEPVRHPATSSPSPASQSAAPLSPSVTPAS